MHIKKDSIHNAVESLFNSFGWITIDTSRCHGVLLDFIACKVYGLYIFVEVKTGNKPLTASERKFIDKHPEHSLVIRSIKEAEEFLINDANRTIIRQ